MSAVRWRDLKRNRMGEEAKGRLTFFKQVYKASQGETRGTSLKWDKIVRAGRIVTCG